jgi:glutaredoxin 3
MTNQRTVPNVFVNGKHLGGNDATQAAIKDGSFMRMLQGK